jgi:hypothetical protein
MLTLWQPWASLCALGVKTIETRSWPAPKSLIGQRIGIHAAARRPTPGEEYGTGWWWQWDVDEGIIVEQDAPTFRQAPAPLGCIVATATLADCVPMVWSDDWPPRDTDAAALEIHASGLALWSQGERDEPIDVTDQLPFGDFRIGRWAWLLSDIKPTTERCPACWGTGWCCDEHERGACKVCDQFNGSYSGCPNCTLIDGCGGSGSCEPIPAAGRQRIWYWRCPGE